MWGKSEGTDENSKSIYISDVAEAFRPSIYPGETEVRRYAVYMIENYEYHTTER